LLEQLRGSKELGLLKTSQLYKMISGGSNDFVIFQLVYASAKVHAELKCI